MSIIRRKFLRQAITGTVLTAAEMRSGVARTSPGTVSDPIAKSPSPGSPARGENEFGPDPIFEKPAPITMAELAKMKIEGVRAVEVSDYIFGNYQGALAPSPPHAGQ